jgi:ADP-ribose pyrophosphatase YjhB (NUDIX family)
MPGGYTNHNERLDESVVREIWEELGLKTEVVDLIGLVTRYTERGGAVFAVFRLRPISGQPTPNGVEVSRIGWFAADEIAAMSDDELWPDSRNPAMAALKAGSGLFDSEGYPGRSESNRGFLLRWK